MKHLIHFSVEGAHRQIWPALEANTRMPAFILCDKDHYLVQLTRRRELFHFYIVNEEECYRALLEHLNFDKEIITYVERRWKEHRKTDRSHLRLV